MHVIINVRSKVILGVTTTVRFDIGLVDIIRYKNNDKYVISCYIQCWGFLARLKSNWIQVRWGLCNNFKLLDPRFIMT